MSLWKIAWRSIQQRALASSLTGISMALGVMLVVAVLVVHGVINRSFLNNSALGYNIVVGAKGGRLDLVLNSVYYLARPVENIPYSYYLELAEGSLKPYVDKAVPVCLGDMYRDFRVVGTTPAFFNDLDYGGHKYTFAEGRNFEPDEYYGAVIGATVARESGLRVHDTFQPAHGVGPEAHEHDPFTILGVLEPTGTPNDRALFINMEGFYLIPEHAKQVDESAPANKPPHADHGDEEHAHEDHVKETRKAEDHPAGEEHAQDEHPEPADAHRDDAEHEHAEGAHTHDEHGHDAHEHHHHEHGEHAHEPLPIEQREVTSVLVLTASIGGAPPELMAPELIKRINKDNVAQAVLPIREMTTLFATFVDPLRIILLSLTVMIVVVSGIGILVSIYNSMSERQHEIAVMRALGAGRRTVMVLVLLESILLSLAGGLAGWAVGHVLIALLSPWIAAQTGVSIGFWQFVGYESVIIPGLIALAALVGYLPALAAYRTDVAKALGANP
ncbi:MAG TPA: ABC transporter permease [Pirellulales bacterium]|jgi:putative ABC transport system permease protein